MQCNDFCLNYRKIVAKKIMIMIKLIPLPNEGEKGQNFMKLLNNTLPNVLPDRHVTKIVYTGLGHNIIMVFL